MLVVLLLLAAAGVLITAAVAVGAAVARTAAQPPPAVLQVDDAVDWIAARLPFEVAAEISHGDVRQILLWHLDYFETVGLASGHGAELGGESVPAEQGAVIADDDAAVDYVVERALGSRATIEPLHIVCVLDRHMHYLKAIGAVGVQVDEDPASEHGPFDQ